MTDKMREEFEVWFKSFADIDALFDDCGQAFAIDQPITYGEKIVNTTVDGAWQVWQASRAALCVELPNRQTVICGTDLLDRELVEQALDDAGVSH